MSELLTAEQVADMIGMTTDYVYELSRRGRIPTITFGRSRRYRREYNYGFALAAQPGKSQGRPVSD